MERFSDAGSIPAASIHSSFRKYVIFKHLLSKRVMYRVMRSHDFVTVLHYFVAKPETKHETKNGRETDSLPLFFTIIGNWLLIAV